MEALRELESPVLLMVSSWELAVDLMKQGCQLLGEPGFGRGTEQELMELFVTSRFPKEIKDKPLTQRQDSDSELQVMKCAVLSGAPGILQHESYFFAPPNFKRAELIDSEWRNGIRRRALNGEDMCGTSGRFPGPDKDGVFHWD